MCVCVCTRKDIVVDYLKVIIIAFRQRAKVHNLYSRGGPTHFQEGQISCYR